MGQQTLNFVPLEHNFPLEKPENRVKSPESRSSTFKPTTFPSFPPSVPAGTPAPAAHRPSASRAPWDWERQPAPPRAANRNAQGSSQVRPAPGPAGGREPQLFPCSFPPEPLSLSFPPQPRGPGRGAEARGSRRKAGLGQSWLMPASPAPPRPQSLGLSLRPRARPTRASPRQGSARSLPPAPSAGHSPGRGSPWSPASRHGRGPRRPPPRQLRLRRRKCAPPATPAPTYLRGNAGLLDSGRGPKAGAEAAGTPPGDPEDAGWGRAGRDAGGRPRASAARREGRGDLALPSAPGHCRRRHFAFHSVSPPPYSAAGFPDVGISRRRLRGGRGLGASARPAAGRERRLRPPALRPPPCARRPPPAPLRGGQRRPAPPPPAPAPPR